MTYVLLVELPGKGYIVKAFKDEKVAREEYQRELAYANARGKYLSSGCALIKGTVLESVGTTVESLKINEERTFGIKTQ